MKRRHMAVLLGAGGLVALFLVTPAMLKSVGFFRVRQVELLGVRYHSQQQIVEALGLSPDQNLFASTRQSEQRLTDLPGVIAVDIERDLPGSLKIVVTEFQPIAFHATSSGLAVLDPDGNHMGFDPAAGRFDLPFVEQPDSVLLHALERVRNVDPALFEQVDAASIRSHDMVILELGRRRIMLHGVPEASQLEMLQAVRNHMAESGREYAQLDARFRDQIVAVRSDN
jgi:cell division septal protein FtsQ